MKLYSWQRLCIHYLINYGGSEVDPNSRAYIVQHEYCTRASCSTTLSFLCDPTNYEQSILKIEHPECDIRALSERVSCRLYIYTLNMPSFQAKWIFLQSYRSTPAWDNWSILGQIVVSMLLFSSVRVVHHGSIFGIVLDWTMPWYTLV
jgi:hypothetical protein